MHAEARAYVERAVSGKTFDAVCEFGSRDVNGSVRSLFATNDYTGIDLLEGPGVDVVGDAAAWSTTRLEGLDCVVCCEVFEHAPNWRLLVKSAHDNLREGGLFIITTATHPREPHSYIDGGPVRLGEHYRNIGLGELTMALGEAGFDPTNMTQVSSRGDLYATAIRR